MNYPGAGQVARYIFENETTANFDRMKSSSEDLSYLGDISTGLDWFAKNYRGATHVYNTAFTRGDTSIIRTIDLVAYHQTVRKLLSDGCKWVDFYVKSGDNDIKSFTESLKPEQLANYNSYLIDTDISLQQCLLIKYGESRGDVLFGWHFTGSSRRQIFHSAHDNTVAFFFDWFSQLESLGEKQKALLSQLPSRPALDADADRSSAPPPP